MKLSLKVLTPGKQEGKLLPITLAQFLIGRDPDCQLRPASPLISKRHCAIVQRDGKVFLTDFDSTNGSFVNDQRVIGEIELLQGDRVKVGSIELQVMIEGKLVERRTPAPPSKPVTVTAKSEPAPAAAAAKAAESAPAAKKAAVLDDEPRGNNDEDAAAMLLALQDDGEPGAVPGAAVPDGTTVMDMKVPTEVLESAKNEGEGKDKGKDAKAKQDVGNTVSAAKSILEKMMRRPR
jgi:pSer/pThr/pTyr-binding forkhead associated (FHA) protein